jgi:hypothetical protein
LPGREERGTRVQTIPDVLATSTAATRSRTCSCPLIRHLPGRVSANLPHCAEVRAPLTARALAWYRERRCRDCVTDVRVSGVDIKEGH